MTYFLDTDICVFILRKKFACRERLAEHRSEEIKIPSMVRAELLAGVRESKNPMRTAQEVEALIAPFETIAFDELAATVYAEMRSGLRKSGNLIGPADMIIAATTLAHHGTLVTHNAGEFSRIAGLQLADWTR